MRSRKLRQYVFLSTQKTSYWRPGTHRETLNLDRFNWKRLVYKSYTGASAPFPESRRLTLQQSSYMTAPKRRRCDGNRQAPPRQTCYLATPAFVHTCNKKNGDFLVPGFGVTQTPLAHSPTIFWATTPPSASASTA
jgi:hypothetical protein